MLPLSNRNALSRNGPARASDAETAVAEPL